MRVIRWRAFAYLIGVLFLLTVRVLSPSRAARDAVAGTRAPSAGREEEVAV